MIDQYILACISEAKKSYKHSDVPIGAIIVKNNEIIAKSHNTREQKNDITGHAEVNVIRKTAKILQRWNLNDCDLYVTLKPCSMCMEIIKQARIKNVYYLLDKLDFKKEYSGTKVSKIEINNYEQMYGQILSDFFKEKR